MALPSRRIGMLLAVVLTIAVAIGVMMSRPGSLSPVEQGLVGTWDVQRLSGQSKQAALVFKADRELRLVDGTLLGHWRVSGNELILDSAQKNPLKKLFAVLSNTSRTTSELVIAPGSNSFTVKDLAGQEAVLTRSSAE